MKAIYHDYSIDNEKTIKMNDSMIDVFHYIVLAEYFFCVINLVDSSELLNHNPSQLLLWQQSDDVEELDKDANKERLYS